MRSIGSTYFGFKSQHIIFIGFGISGSLSRYIVSSISVIFQQSLHCSSFLGINCFSNFSKFILSYCNWLFPEIDRLPSESIKKWCQMQFPSWTNSAYNLISFLKKLSDEVKCAFQIGIRYKQVYFSIFET